MSPVRHSKRRGFSLIELLVVVALMALLLGLLVSATERARRAQRCTVTIHLLRQVGVASHGAHDNFKKLPPFYGWYVGKLGSVHAHMLPHIEGAKIYNQFQGETLRNAAERGPFIPYLSPRDPTAPDGVFPGTNVGVTSVLGNANAFWFTGTMQVGLHGTGYPVGCQRMPGSFVNGTSNSVFFATACGDASATADGPSAGNVKGNHNYSNGYAHFPNISPRNDLPNVALPAPGQTTPHGWARPTRANYPVPAVLNEHSTAVWRQPTQLLGSGCIVCMGDGSTRTVSPDIAQAVWGAVCETWVVNVVPPDWHQ